MGIKDHLRECLAHGPPNQFKAAGSDGATSDLCNSLPRRVSHFLRGAATVGNMLPRHAVYAVWESLSEKTIRDLWTITKTFLQAKNLPAVQDIIQTENEDYLRNVLLSHVMYGPLELADLLCVSLADRFGPSKWERKSVIDGMSSYYN